MNDAAEPQPPPPREPPTGLFAKLADFANNLDERAWRAVAVSVAMVLVAGALLVVGRLYYGAEIEAFIDNTLGEARRTHIGLPVAIAVFTLTAYVGAPQFVQNSLRTGTSAPHSAQRTLPGLPQAPPAGACIGS